MSCPRATKGNVVLPVKEVRCLDALSFQVSRAGKRLTCISRIQLHGLKALMLLQRSTSPFPDTAQIRLAAEFISSFDHGNRMPVFEAHVRPFKVDEEVFWVETRCCARVAVKIRA